MYMVELDRYIAKAKLFWMVQYYFAIVLTTASTSQSHMTSPSKKQPNFLKGENAGDKVLIGF